MRKDELIEDYKKLLADVLEKIAYAQKWWSGRELSDITLDRIKETCEDRYFNLTGEQYAYDENNDEDFE